MRRARRRLLPPAGLRRALVLALVALLVLAGTVLAAAPGVRDALLEFFGLQGATVERRSDLPTPPARAPAGARPAHDPRRGGRASSPFEPLVPSALGEPDGVYLRGDEELSLAYRAGPGLPRAATTRLGLLVSEFRGDLHPDLHRQDRGRGHGDRAAARGRRACDLDRGGAALLLLPRRRAADAREGELRLAQNVLLLESGPLLVRLEGAFDRERALEIARSLR